MSALLLQVNNHKKKETKKQTAFNPSWQ
jgi:hypothetical protein